MCPPERKTGVTHDAEDSGEEPEGPPIWQGREQRPAEHRRTRRLARRVSLVAVALLAVLVGGTAGALYYVSDQLGDQVHRVPKVFAHLDPATRPPEGDGTTFLLMGIDSRSPRPLTGSEATAGAFVPGRARSDAIMLLHVGPDGTHGSVVSLPRDSWVPVAGHGHAKLNAAYSYGGPSGLVAAVEAVTHVRVDHFAVIDFSGFRDLTDAVGGIDVRVAAPTESRGVRFHAGLNHLDGKEALIYVRQRHGLPHGDLDREKRQQNALRALLRGAVSDGVLGDPAKAYRLLDTLTRYVSVDDTLDNAALRELATHWQGLRANDMRFVTAPVSGLGVEGRQSVVYLDRPGTRALCDAAVSGDIDRYLADHHADTLPDVPR